MATAVTVAQLQDKGSHDLDLKRRSLAQSMQALASPPSEISMHTTLGDGEATPTIPTSIEKDSPSTPVTPTPAAFSEKRQSLTPDAPSPATRRTSARSFSGLRRESLTSSRPAPPSPAISRRTSAAMSRQSSLPQSARQSRDVEKVASSLTFTPSRASKARSWLIKVRDFAFPQSDERHEGRGSDAPRPNRPRYRSSTLSSSSSSSAPEDEADEEIKHTGWGSFRWNTLSSHFKWGSDAKGADEPGPSSMDFERNFDTSSPTEEAEQPYSDSDVGDVDQDEDYYANQDGPLVPGLYRAVYAFEPEGSTEMALEEGQVVKIVARGGGVGWAVVEKDDGEHALVPESYLELVEADSEAEAE